jgi:hypothetical protein
MAPGPYFWTNWNCFSFETFQIAGRQWDFDGPTNNWPRHRRTFEAAVVIIIASDNKLVCFRRKENENNMNVDCSTFAKQTKQFKTRKSLLQKKLLIFVWILLYLFSLYLIIKIQKYIPSVFGVQDFVWSILAKKQTETDVYFTEKETKKQKFVIWKFEKQQVIIVGKEFCQKTGFFYISRCSTQQTNNTQSKTNSTYKTWILFTPEKTLFLFAHSIPLLGVNKVLSFLFGRLNCANF